MSRYYLDFEKPIRELDEQILELENLSEPSKETKESLKSLIKLRTAQIEKIYSSLSRWQRVQLARHPDRPYSLDYIQHFSPNFFELHLSLIHI